MTASEFLVVLVWCAVPLTVLALIYVAVRLGVRDGIRSAHQRGDSGEL